jgi:anaerobic ribonucleoside-triphosphate reductase activating protein
VGLWLAGCERSCPGCLSPDFFEPKPSQKISAEDLAKKILLKAREFNLAALTVSGGEPFARAEGLKILLETIKRSGLKDILVYTGFDATELLARHAWIPELIAALVDGPYKESEPSAEIFRGSRNQKIAIFDQTLAPQYHSWSKRKKRQAQIILENGQIRILGVPGEGDYDKAFAAAGA